MITASDQLKNEANVIGYQPVLEYKKEQSQKEEEPASSVSTTPISTSLRNQPNYYKTLDLFKKYTPSSTLGILQSVSNDLRTLVDNLTDAFGEGNWGQYDNIDSLISSLDYDSPEYTYKFINFHSHNIKGSIVPELIGAIYDASKKIKLVANTLKTLYYGDKNITDEKAQEYDHACVNKMLAYREKKEAEKINYVAISSDALLNRTTNLYAYAVNASCTDLSRVVKTIDIDNYTNRDRTELVKKMYLNVNQDISDRISAYETYQSIEILEKTLYNYYNKRQDLINLCNLGTGIDDSFVANKISEYQDEVDEAIQNINRAYVGVSAHIDELCKLETEKYYLMNIYDQLSQVS